VGQSPPNAQSKRADIVAGVQVTQVTRAARALIRDERAVPQVTKIAKGNQARQI
jgi:hypothetical protein